MQQHSFGATGRNVPVVGQGTWYLDEASRSLAVATLRRGLDLGMTHIDTAELYGAGAAEELVGEAIAGRRSEVFLVSKVSPDNASRSGTVAACESSLARLRTDRLDCYLLHWPGKHPIEHTIEGFEALRRAGKILAWGVSNFDVADLDEVWAKGGGGRLACNQVLYHLQQRAVEHAVIPWCVQHGVATVAYSPFGRERFPTPHEAGGRVVTRIAAAHEATARQVALAFLTRQASLFAIPKASTPTHAEENAGAGDLTLSPSEIAEIDAAFPGQAAPRHLPTL